ncbi:hypothetical protein MANES_17G022801v8 [Manihot esculenta]|uniref:Uncharacterized protein n=1 Tax=Manihot esculenta TaxID=3983 RepID=A0ACB7G3C7_MANES|nr:hypothetical protein MANES_17G022801v8 [Manihot esculenta]
MIGFIFRSQLFCLILKLDLDKDCCFGCSSEDLELNLLLYLVMVLEFGLSK